VDCLKRNRKRFRFETLKINTFQTSAVGFSIAETSKPPRKDYETNTFQRLSPRGAPNALPGNTCSASRTPFARSRRRSGVRRERSFSALLFGFGFKIRDLQVRLDRGFGTQELSEHLGTGVEGKATMTCSFATVTVGFSGLPYLNMFPPTWKKNGISF